VASSGDFRLDDPKLTQQALITRVQTLAQLIATSDPVDPAQLVSTFLNL
jgi:hypothetical protein